MSLRGTTPKSPRRTKIPVDLLASRVALAGVDLVVLPFVLVVTAETVVTGVTVVMVVRVAALVRVLAQGAVTAAARVLSLVIEAGSVVTAQVETAQEDTVQQVTVQEETAQEETDQVETAQEDTVQQVTAQQETAAVRGLVSRVVPRVAKIETIEEARASEIFVRTKTVVRRSRQ